MGYTEHMTLNLWLKQSEQYLDSFGIQTARLDCLVLAEDVLGKDRAWILATPEAELKASQNAKLTKLLKRRAKHEPLAYIRGKVEFYGREFIINSNVLVPRPESETIIDMLIELYKARPCSTCVKDCEDCPCNWNVADVGCGSGALGVTAALEVPNLSVELLEIDRKALELAKINVDNFTIGISVMESDLMSGSTQQNDILLCNLPYVPDEYAINSAAKHEPAIALYGGEDGLDLYRQLFSQITHNKHVPLYLLIESLPSQHAKLSKIADTNSYTLRKTNDFIQLYESQTATKNHACSCKDCP